MTIWWKLALGVALFLYGMSFLSRGLQTALGLRLRRWMGRAAATPARGILLGAAVTAVVQSSSAISVIVVGMADAGVLALHQAAAVIVGANVGATVTAWLVALNMDSGGLGPLLPLLAVVGLVLWVWGRGDSVRGGGQVGLGLAALFLGLEVMTDALGGLPTEGFWPVMLRNPWFGLLLGTAVTAVIQSSSASVGMLQALSATGAVSLGAALPVVLGENVGTCVTALLSAVTGGKTGRLSALWHLLFNAVGAAVCFLLFLPVRHWDIFMQPATPGSVAVIHTAFNALAAAAVLPLLYKWHRRQKRGETCTVTN